MRQIVGSFLSHLQHRRAPPYAPVPVVALILASEDRSVLASAAAGQTWDVHFAESYEQTSVLASRLAAPVVLLDRDWPGMEWRKAVESLAASRHRTCVVLVSGAADSYLWQELVRRDGYDILPKPLRPGAITRIIKLALSYWRISAVARPAGVKD